MPYTLVILRHAKATRPDDLPDSQRPLNARGHADATAAGVWLAANGYQPGLVLCSPARRTRQTWDDVASGLATSAEVSYPAELYTEGVGAQLTLVRAVDPTVHTVLLIGHNPSVSLLSAILSSADGADLPDGLPTAGIAVHQCESAWSSWRAGGAPLAESYVARG